MRLQTTEATFDTLPFTAETARVYGYLIAAVVAAGQNPRPRRLDLMIAATAYEHGYPVYTRNPKDFSALNRMMTVVAV